MKEDGEELAAVREKLVLLRDEEKHAQEQLANAESRLKILDTYGKTLGTRKTVNIEEGIETYRKSREAVFKDHMEATVSLRKANKEISELVKDEKRLLHAKLQEVRKETKVKAKAKKLKEKERDKERLRRSEKKKEKDRIRRDRERFWPRQCWSVRITLDVVAFTPDSSRRSSVASASDIVKVPLEKESADPESPPATISTCDMSLSYVTSSAWWSPSYDLAFTTTSNSAKLCFDAQLTNRTSENWTGCKIVLSTSQTTFSGIQDTIPTLVPWRIRLGTKGYGAKPGEVLDSREERAEKGGWRAQQNAWGAQKARNHLYGLHNNANGFGVPVSQNANGFGVPVPQNANRNSNANIASYAPQQQAAPFSQMAPSAAPIAAASNAMPNRMAKRAGGGGGLFGGSAARAGVSEGVPQYDTYDPTIVDEPLQPEGADEETILEPDAELTYQESAFEESGMTTTYDLPGLKTLNTAPTASRQRVARISFFGNVVFSHTVVAKYRPAAYLKAKLRNVSKFTLIKGPVGLSLDGSFIGRSNLARCSAGDMLTMSLGVDPSIKVSYPKPEATRSTSGLFTKENSCVYTRTVILTNTNSSSSSKPVNLIVLDQVPVSEDDKLRVDIVHPRGMSVGSSPVKAGVPSKDTGEAKDWGKATASLKKAGEVCWDVALNPGRGVKLALQYEVALPAGEQVEQC